MTHRLVVAFFWAIPFTPRSVAARNHIWRGNLGDPNFPSIRVPQNVVGRFTYMIYGDFLANVVLFFRDPSAHNGAGIESYLAT